MRLRLAGVNDLIAAEGKYHNKCLNAFKYDIQKTKKECETIDLAMIFLVQELGYAASKNQILQLSDVWERYCSLVAQTNGDIPQSFISRRTTFKEYLQTDSVMNINFYAHFIGRFLKGNPVDSSCILATCVGRTSLPRSNSIGGR
jgi:hypothetical protein